MNRDHHRERTPEISDRHDDIDTEALSEQTLDAITGGMIFVRIPNMGDKSIAVSNPNPVVVQTPK